MCIILQMCVCACVCVVQLHKMAVKQHEGCKLLNLKEEGGTISHTELNTEFTMFTPLERLTS